MNDTEIIKLFFDRSERAILQISEKYGSYLYTIAYNILCNRDDAEEVLNDTYHAVWNSIPPAMPVVLRYFLSKITRNLAFKRLEYNCAGKRSCTGMIALEELGECICVGSSVENIVEAKEIGHVLNSFLSGLSEVDVAVFLLRYYYVFSIRDIAVRCNISERSVKYKLSRLRAGFRDALRKEGYTC